MELKMHFTIHAILQLLKQGKILQALRLKHVGYHINDTHVVLQGIGFQMIELTNLPYDLAYYKQCHNNSGYHEKHWTSKMKVTREVYRIRVSSSTEELIVETTNESAYRYIKKQYDAIDFIEDRKIQYNERSISLADSSYRGIGMSTDKVTFPSIVAYEKYKETVKLIPRTP